MRSQVEAVIDKAKPDADLGQAVVARTLSRHTLETHRKPRHRRCATVPAWSRLGGPVRRLPLG
ncbi:MAG: hypothetical protein ACK5N0_05560 [Synechococcaceae cyanobacterium]